MKIAPAMRQRLRNLLEAARACTDSPTGRATRKQLCLYVRRSVRLGSKRA